MKTTRTFASICLSASCIALIAAANVSVGDQPGVFQMTSGAQPGGQSNGPHGIRPVPAPPVVEAPGSVTLGAPGITAAPGTFSLGGGTTNSGSGVIATDVPVTNGVVTGSQAAGTVTMGGGGFAPNGPTQYLQRSGAVTSPMVGGQAYQTPSPFGPQLMFEQNIDNGLGFRDAYTRINARLPWHINPNRSVIMGDLSASVTSDGDPFYNFGVVGRHFNEEYNRILGLNFFADVDYTGQLDDYSRLGVGFESMGRWIDFFMNGYLVQGNDSVLGSSRPLNTLNLQGMNVVQTFEQFLENQYSGFDAKIGGPLPVIGRRGANLYLGSYYLGNEQGQDALGFSLQGQLLATESMEFNVYYTNDETFGENSWVSMSYTIPHNRQKRILRPGPVQERLSDPVRRHHQMYSKMERNLLTSTVINPATGLPWKIYYVDPNNTMMGDGTVENPFMTLADADAANSATVDAIRIAARDDGDNTKLQVAGGIDLFDDQALFSAHKDFALFNTGGLDFVIPGTTQPDGFIPTISDPTITAGDAVIRVANGSRIHGLGIDASNAAGTMFGTGVGNTMPFTDVSLTCNVFTNYTIGTDLTDADGTLIFDENMYTGLAGQSETGLQVATLAGSTSDLLVSDNIVTNNSTVGINVTATAGATINANNPTGVPVGVGTPSGILRNNVSAGGDGIVVTAETGATINAVVDENVSTGNTFNGFIGRSDGGTWNLQSMAGNTFSENLENGAFLHYLNGGDFNAVSEDVDGDGILGPGEDLNGNGRLDHGIVSNTMNDNTIAGLCIFGEHDGAGVFDIGGPSPLLGNTFNGNTGAGVAVDLQDTATAQIDALFNTMQGGTSDPGLTIVLDFIDPGQGSVVDALGRTVDPFDVTNFGFAAGDFDMVTNAVLQTIQNAYASIPTTGQDARSTIPDGFMLDLDFVIGDTGVAPSNGATEYYVMTIGDSATSLGGLLGEAADIGNIRNALGLGPGQGLFGVPQAIGDSSMAVYASEFGAIGGLTPPNATGPTALIRDGDLTTSQVNGLTSGNLTATRFALGNVAAHELGHTLSLRHVLNAGAITPTGAPPVMGTGALDQPNQAFIEPTEFVFSGINPGEIPGEAPFTQNSNAQLATAVGLRTAGREQKNGITVVAQDDARLLPSTFINNTITASSERGINIEMQDRAVAEGVTIQGNTITGGGIGVRLAADMDAVIFADNTIGGAGMNTFRGVSYSQGNVINSNSGDGIQVLATNGGTIYGNVINNEITDNGGNGVSLLIDGGGHLFFGDPGSDQVVTGNTITGNTGTGIFASSTVDSTVDNTEQTFELTVVDNVINNNQGGGLIAELNGLNNVPPGPPAFGFDENNVLDLVVSQSGPGFTIDGNAGVGIGAVVNGTGLANIDISNVVITGTTAGTDPLFNGDGINLIRRDSSLLLATLEDITSSGNASNGLEVDTQGTNKDNINQPMVGTVNSVTWNNGLYENNGENGASFTTRGDSQLFANGTANVTRNNTLSGVLVDTQNFSAFGDPTLAPPANRTVFNGLISDSNGLDGVTLLSTGGSTLALEITSERIPTTSGAHAALNTAGDTVISNNGRDGIHIATRDTATPDILITAETPVTPTSARTVIMGNGTNNTMTIAAGTVVPTAIQTVLAEDLVVNLGGSGVLWDSFDAAAGSVQIYHTDILNNIAGDSDDTNGDGILTFQEDLFGNFVQNYQILGAPGVGDDLISLTPTDLAATFAGDDDSGPLYTEGNLDIDVLGGDGIEFSYFQSSTSTLIVGDMGMGNRIQGNQDDGIALTGDVREIFLNIDPLGNRIRTGDGPPLGVTSPTIRITENLIGGDVDGVPTGNLGDGVSVRSFGFAASGVPTANVDFDLDDGDGLNPGSGGGAADRFFTGGPIPDILLTSNTIANNFRTGVNIRLQGGAGSDSLRNVPVVLDPAPNAVAATYNRIALVDNTIVSNGEHGVFLRADTDMNQNRIVFTPNTDPDLDGTFDTNNFGPTGVETASTAFPNAGTFGPNDVDASFPYLNFATVQNTLFTATGNTIQNNGTGTEMGHGIEIRVGTGAFVAADVRDNIFGGNLEEDLFTGAFYSAMDFDNPLSGWREDRFVSIDNDGALQFDVVYLDDAALLDMRFTGNTGDQINPLEDSAFDFSALPFLGATPDQSIAIDISAVYLGDPTDPIRGGGPAGVFKIDDAFSLNAPVNSFIEFGVTQDVEDAFATANGLLFGNFDILNISAEPIWPEEPFQDAD